MNTPTKPRSSSSKPAVSSAPSASPPSASAPSREQTSVGSSLFAQPLMLQAVPLEGAVAHTDPSNSPEARANPSHRRA